MVCVTIFYQMPLFNQTFFCIYIFLSITNTKHPAFTSKLIEESHKKFCCVVLILSSSSSGHVEPGSIEFT